LHSGAVNPHDQFLKEGWPIVSFLHTSGCVRAPLGFYLQPINQLSPFLSPSLLLPFPLSLSFLSSPSFFEAKNFVPVASFGIHRERTPRDLQGRKVNVSMYHGWYSGDGNAPPVYYPREYVYLFHKSLYGMIQSPRTWYQLWCSICTSFGLQKLIREKQRFFSYTKRYEIDP
jgi:hypothetical protein